MTAPIATKHLWLIFDAGPSTYCVDATSLVEVATPDKSGETLRGHLAIHDLSSVLGGAAESRPGTVVVLDTTPTLALRVRRVHEVSAQDTGAIFDLPQPLMKVWEPLGARVLATRHALAWEFDADALASGHRVRSSGRAARFCAGHEGPTLQFGIAEKTFSVPLAQVVQIVPWPTMSVALPVADALWGACFALGRVWPVVAVAPLAAPAAYAVLVDTGSAYGAFAANTLGGVGKQAQPDGQVLDIQSVFS